MYPYCIRLSEWQRKREGVKGKSSFTGLARQKWEELQKNGSIFGGELDKSTGCFHLSNLDQVRPTLQKFFMNVKEDLYLLQIDAKKPGDGLIYELVDAVIDSLISTVHLQASALFL
ncbi:hypothetical protein SLEP1_g1529 [Rubroshorea leprosula]|uniref:Uncharacterized protein n=1 Tax=Rubroshorea leprosula TaxID=152421 RepID=A0AAV5HE26_9ROSI|nr:hypothetical protein SLEP1_g1529 [Rubroshorea leprosula]